MVDDDATSPLPAHRPSRRSEIIEAAIRQFARNGFVDAAISDIAEDAEMAVTAVYYHFSGKEELYGAAVSRVYESISEIVAGSRGDELPAPDGALTTAIDRVWSWIDEHPDEAALLYSQLPGATRQVARLRQDFEEQHARQAFRYFSDPDRDRPAEARQAIETLMARTLVDLLISVHTMRLGGGPLSQESGRRLRNAVHHLAERLVTV